MLRHVNWFFASYGKVASTTLATFSLLTSALAQQATVKWVAPDPMNPQRAHVEVSGAGQAILDQAASFKSPTEWNRVLMVFTPVIHGPETPMAGMYRVETGALRFQPLFPLERGMSYTARFTPASGDPIIASHSIPQLATTPTTVVQTIYPTADVLPENLLKFYIRFSAPMQRGDVYDHIHLLDAQGKEVDLPFLRLGEELWDPGMTRLTLLFDPGRIKRGVQPLEEIGPALIEGRRFSLVIDKAWKDANGQPLKESFRKDFSVGPADRTTPDPARWKIIPPKPALREPLRIEFDEPMDQALALRMISVTDGSGRTIEGQATLDQNERRWSLVPADTWQEGFHRIIIRSTIEDLAGNNIGKPFDVDLASGGPRQLPREIVTLPFEVR